MFIDNKAFFLSFYRSNQTFSPLLFFIHIMMLFHLNICIAFVKNPCALSASITFEVEKEKKNDTITERKRHCRVRREKET